GATRGRRCRERNDRKGRTAPPGHNAGGRTPRFRARGPSWGGFLRTRGKLVVKLPAGALAGLAGGTAMSVPRNHARETFPRPCPEMGMSATANTPSAFTEDAEGHELGFTGCTRSIPAFHGVGRNRGGATLKGRAN